MPNTKAYGPSILTNLKIIDALTSNINEHVPTTNEDKANQDYWISKETGKNEDISIDKEQLEFLVLSTNKRSSIVANKLEDDKGKGKF